MSVVVTPEPAAVVERVTSIVVTREKGGAPAVTKQGIGGTVVVTRGIPGPPGPVGSADGALLVVNRLNEFDDETKKAEARANLGLQTIDGGTFF